MRLRCWGEAGAWAAGSSKQDARRLGRIPPAALNSLAAKAGVGAAASRPSTTVIAVSCAFASRRAASPACPLDSATGRLAPSKLAFTYMISA